MIQKLDEGIHLITGIEGHNENGVILSTDQGARFFVEYTSLPEDARRFDFNFFDYVIVEKEAPRDCDGVQIGSTVFEIVTSLKYFERMVEPERLKRE